MMLVREKEKQTRNHFNVLGILYTSCAFHFRSVLSVITSLTSDRDMLLIQFILFPESKGINRTSFAIFVTQISYEESASKVPHVEPGWGGGAGAGRGGGGLPAGLALPGSGILETGCHLEATPV